MPESLLTLSGPSLPGLPEPDMRRSLMSGLTLITEPASSPESLAWGPMACVCWWWSLLGSGHNIRCASCVVSGCQSSLWAHLWETDRVSLVPVRCSPPGCHSPAGVLCCTVYCVQCRAQPVLCCTVLCHLPRLAWAAAATTAEKIATELWRYLLLCYRQKRSKLVFTVDRIPNFQRRFFSCSWNKTLSLLSSLSGQILVIGQILSSKLTSRCPHREYDDNLCVTPETLPY